PAGDVGEDGDTNSPSDEASGRRRPASGPDGTPAPGSAARLCRAANRLRLASRARRLAGGELALAAPASTGVEGSDRGGRRVPPGLLRCTVAPNADRCDESNRPPSPPPEPSSLRGQESRSAGVALGRRPS